MSNMEIVQPEAAIRRAIGRWSRLSDLASFAAKRHGFGDSNGGFGVTYPGDVDPGDIPEGYVEVYGLWGPPEGYELLVLESQYLEVLTQMLAAAGHATEAKQVRLLTDQR